jgi:hypothetical protein
MKWLLLAAIVAMAASGTAWAQSSTGVGVARSTSRSQAISGQGGTGVGVGGGNPSAAITSNSTVPAEANSTATDMAETAARDLANVEQAIQQLEASRQEQIVRDNAELAERLKATEEQVARDNAQIVEQLKAVQSQMAHDNAALSSELKAGLAQMTRAIAKASEKPTQRASEQRPRPKPSRQIVTGTIRPAVRAPQFRAPQTTTYGRSDSCSTASFNAVQCFLLKLTKPGGFVVSRSRRA